MGASVCHFFLEVVVLYDLTLDKHCRCFKSQGEGAADLLQVLGHSHELEEASFSSCHQIPAVAWQKLRGAKWAQAEEGLFRFVPCRDRNG